MVLLDSVLLCYKKLNFFLFFNFIGNAYGPRSFKNRKSPGSCNAFWKAEKRFRWVSVLA